ncbi:hypothetical protein NEHOM01_0509 [Nematocida homosporus]|uniref:uncharacterized protein n=1 Tax=Nematocida homosporus TaxID=1912981 RepID=UPI0022202F0B|nr:uncharacterized protein NEHOM01_0509 [Nematocida homosporus]KAI5184958.1 hypothetical protein NEHOM01_0509 [Nematocida homosporus]
MTEYLEDNLPLIVTHNGTFHLDEVLGCFILSKLFPTYKIVRSRDKEVIAKGTIVLDVGGVYDPDNNRFDHHQHGFTEVYQKERCDILMSSAGLVFKKFGLQYLSQEFDLSRFSKKEVQELIDRVYFEYLITVDAQDNGREASEDNLYHARNLGDLVKTMNPWFTDEEYNNTTKESRDAITNRAFFRAMEIMGSDFERACRVFVLEQYNMVELLKPENCQIIGQVHTGQYAYFAKAGMTSMGVKHLNAVRGYNILVFIVADTNVSAGQTPRYTVNCISKNNCHYPTLAPLPKEWRGHRDDVFQMSSDRCIRDCLFVHATGFFGIATSRDCAEYMAKRALEDYY